PGGAAGPRLGAGHRELAGGALDRLGERQGRRRLVVAALRGPGGEASAVGRPAVRGAAEGRSSAEQVREVRGHVATGRPVAATAACGSSAGVEETGEDVLEASAASLTAGARAEAGAAAHLADLVVLLPGLLVGQHLVRLPDLLELRLGLRVTRVLVGMVLPRELPVRLLDLSVRSISGDAQRLVEILLEPVVLGSGIHLAPPFLYWSATAPHPTSTGWGRSPSGWSSAPAPVSTCRAGTCGSGTRTDRRISRRAAAHPRVPRG